MSENDQLNYNINYTKRMEQLFHEQIRKTIDVEVRLSMAFENINEIQNMYQESQKQVEVQNEFMQQAGRSIEDLTTKNKDFESNIENLKNDYENRIVNLEKDYNSRISNLEKMLSEMTTERNDIASKYNDVSEKLKESNRESDRQRVEMQQLYDDYVLLKEKTEVKQPAKIINKKTKEDNIF